MVTTFDGVKDYTNPLTLHSLTTIEVHMKQTASLSGPNDRHTTPDGNDYYVERTSLF
jgi:hypothetical protein